MTDKITITRPTNTFGSAIKETTIGFPAQRLTLSEAIEFVSELSGAIKIVSEEMAVKGGSL